VLSLKDGARQSGERGDKHAGGRGPAVRIGHRGRGGFSPAGVVEPSMRRGGPNEKRASPPGTRPPRSLPQRPVNSRLASAGQREIPKNPSQIGRKLIEDGAAKPGHDEVRAGRKLCRLTFR